VAKDGILMAREAAQYQWETSDHSYLITDELLTFL